MMYMVRNIHGLCKGASDAERGRGGGEERENTIGLKCGEPDVDCKRIVSHLDRNMGRLCNVCECIKSCISSILEAAGARYHEGTTLKHPY